MSWQIVRADARSLPLAGRTVDLIVTSPHRVPMAAKILPVNLHAVEEARLLVQQGMTGNKASQQVAQRYGVAARTVRDWAQRNGTPLGVLARAEAEKAREVAQVEHQARRAQLRLEMSQAALTVLGRLVEERDGKQAQGFAVTLGILIDKIRLEEGEVTSRSESWTADEWTRQVRMLEAEVARAGPRRDPPA